jgi:secreted trypsin-like serine protease
MSDQAQSSEQLIVGWESARRLGVSEECPSMDDARFDTAVRRFAGTSTRRGAIGILAGLSGLALTEAAGKKRKRRNRKARRVSVEITDGEPDGTGHPYVGLMVAQKGDGTPLWRCSGTLLSPTLFLTAAHCVANDGDDVVDHVEIWFDADVENNPDYPNTGDVGGTPHPHPDYNPNAFYTDDVGVVVLDAPGYDPGAFGTLPTQDQLNTLATDQPKKKKDVTFTAVGYGLQQAFPDAADWKDEAEKVRMVAYPQLLQINNGNTLDYYLLLTNNPITGGTCFGDSGGPNFLGDTKVIAAVTSYGMNPTCAGTGGVYRMDRADALNWLSEQFGDHLP